MKVRKGYSSTGFIYCEGEKNGVLVEVAMQHNDAYNEATYSFVNNIITPEGGTHLAGFRNALTKTFNEYARANKILIHNACEGSVQEVMDMAAVAHLATIKSRVPFVNFFDGVMG